MMSGDFVLVMSSLSRTSFDFVGEYLDEDDKFIRLKNPLVLDYGDDTSLKRLAPLHVPVGMLDVTQKSEMRIPKDGIAYMVSTSADVDDFIHEEYKRFWGTEQIDK